MDKLNKYNKKRDFNKTVEPVGKEYKSKKKLRFVVQHHIARKDHYDLRLEWNGVMKSWAVPKGPSYNSKDRRLAIMVEDHPLEYRNFEGIIPKGEYGGGSVMIWDEGYFEPIIKPNFKKEIKFILYGTRLKGKWALIHFKEDNWLLIKDKDEYNEFKDISKLDTSIRTGKKMDEIGGITFTNPNKVIFKKENITKGDIINYYKKVSKRMLPYINNRLISTVRCPSGNSKTCFFKKHFENIDKYLGKKILKNDKGDKEDYYYIKDDAGLLSEVQMNSYEFHIWGSKINSLEHPDLMVFDFDPDTNLDINVIREGVLNLKKILDKLKIKSYLKTSGGKGYHVVCKINSPSWKIHREISKKISELLVEKYPNKYTTNIRKNKRNGKIFIDWVRNTRSSTFVAPYSIRIKNGRVSMPIKWSELYSFKPDEITMDMAIKRLKLVDPWKGME